MGFWGLLSYLKRYKALVAGNIFCNIFMAIFIVINVPLFIPLLEILFEKDVIIDKPDGPLAFSNAIDHIKYFFSRQLDGYAPEDAILWVCLALVMLFFLKNFFRYMAMFFISPVRTGIVRDLRNELYDKITALPLSFYSEEKKGDLMARVTSDVQEIESSILNVLETIFREPIVIIGSLLFMLLISVKLTLFVFVLILFTALVIGGVSRTLKKKSFEAQERLGGLISRLEETLGGIRIIKAFNAQKFLNEKFSLENEKYRGVLTRIYWRRDLSSPLSEFLGITVVAVLMWYGSQLVFSQQIHASTFFAFLYAFYNVINPAKAFSSAFYNVQKGLAAIKRINFILEAPDSLKEDSKNQSIDQLGKTISFNNVNFTYPGHDKQVLTNINIDIAKGSTIALVGSSGSGKTTIVDLLCRFYDVTSGNITIDGQDIRELQSHDLRNLMGIVSQEPVLFNDTVASNIRFGKTEISDDQVQKACQIANAHEFIQGLENGYETVIGDRGVKLSGGQRQRLTIARAILNNPPILILDEATSSLDSESEKLVQESIEKIMEGRTAIIIAHRLSTIKNADCIVVLEDGKIVESGSHTALLSQEGPYRKLVEMQSF